jgi:hypothetical protein
MAPATRRLLLTSVVLCVLGGPLQPQSPPATIPPRWYCGDTHAHIQLCGAPENLDVPTFYTIAQAQHVNVACLQLWAKFGVTPEQFLSQYAPHVTAVEHPVSVGDPDTIVQAGVEVSGFAASQFGHVQALNIQDGAFPTAALHTGPILDFFRAQPGALTGYAHVLWWNDYSPAQIGGGGGGGAPFLAPIDTALGEIDFLEARRVVEPGPLSWHGLYHKLLGAGLRVALVGGSDNSCVEEQIGDTRTWARIAEEPLTFAGWCEAVAAGETSVSDGSAVFLEMRLDDLPIGASIDLPSPGSLSLHATLHVSAGVSASGRLKLLRNGVDIASKPYQLPEGGSVAWSLSVPFSQSAWIAVAADSGAHTGPTYVSVSDRPIATLQDASYLRAYCDELAEQIGDFAVPAAAPAILARVAAARKVYAAFEALCLPLPPGAVSIGRSTPACHGPIAIGVDSPPSTSFRLTCVHAPPGTTGYLLMGAAADPAGTPQLGTTLYVDLAQPFVKLPVLSNGGGYAELPLTLPAGSRFVGQFVWANTPGCGNGGPLSASNALWVVIP